MHLIPIESADDPRVSEYRDVPEPELVRARGLFVAEGRLVVERVIDDGRYRIRSLLLSEAARHALDRRLSALAADVPVYVCALDDLLAITGFNIHRGCLALVERPPETPMADLLEEACTVLVLEAVANPDNIGGVFRNAAAFGVDAVLLSPGCGDPLYRKAIRTSMAATLAVAFARVPAWPAALLDLKTRGFTIAALTPRLSADSLNVGLETLGRRRIALVLGAEGDGLSQSAEVLADCCLRIPTRPSVDSLNVAVASGIALHAICSRRSSSG